eukprot:CCRYP_015072-RA/>CCRYP_015072-RA protein AED:0.27 eAED:0.27 QI:0/0.83/0.85/1/0.66/0.71/7/1178/423
MRDIFLLDDVLRKVTSDGADLHRNEIKKGFAAAKTSYSSISKSLEDYIPLINQILISCSFQPQAARLDKPLLFSWISGVECSKTKKLKYFESEALMFELVLSLSTYALCESNLGCDLCVSGDFAQALKKFAKATGVFQCLGDDLLPGWMAKSKQHAEMEKESLAETRVGVSAALTSLHMAMSQQMAIAAILVKRVVPNYALVGKLCLGVAVELESFVSTMRSKASVHMARLEPSFLTLVTFSINVQRALSLYFLSRHLWNSSEFGVAISALSEATVAMRTRSSPTGRGLPEIEEKGPLQVLSREVADFRLHMECLLTSWEKDNSLVYFDKVPPSVPSDKALKPIQLNKIDEFHLEERDHLPFSIPGAKSNVASASPPPSYNQAIMNDSQIAANNRNRSDSDLARELHEKLNSETDHSSFHGSA